jgi:hypothetical protein
MNFRIIKSLYCLGSRVRSRTLTMHYMTSRFFILVASLQTIKSCHRAFLDSRMASATFSFSKNKPCQYIQQEAIRLFLKMYIFNFMSMTVICYALASPVCTGTSQTTDSSLSILEKHSHSSVASSLSANREPAAHLPTSDEVITASNTIAVAKLQSTTPTIGDTLSSSLLNLLSTLTDMPAEVLSKLPLSWLKALPIWNLFGNVKARFS